MLVVGEGADPVGALTGKLMHLSNAVALESEPLVSVRFSFVSCATAFLVLATGRGSHYTLLPRPPSVEGLTLSAEWLLSEDPLLLSAEQQTMKQRMFHPTAMS